MKPLYFLFLILLFSGCSLERSIQRATRTVEVAEKTQNTLQEKHPELVAEKFAEWFPVKEKETIIRDTVSVPTFVKADPIPYPEPRPKTSTPAPATLYRPVVACPDLSYFTNTILELRRKTQNSAAALEAVKEKYRQVQHTLFQEQAAHRNTKAAAEKAQKLKIAWIWFSLFLGLLIILFVVGKIFRFV